MLFAQKPPSTSRSIPSRILGILSYDIVWVGISLFFLCATVVSYFLIFQPPLLSRYTSGLEQNIDAIVKSYTTKTAAIQQQTQTLSNRANIGLNANAQCSDNAKYNTFTEDMKTVQSLQMNVGLEAEYKIAPNAWIFWEPQSKAVYQSMVVEYTESLERLNSTLEASKRMIELARYKNIWIESCKKIQENKGSTIELQDECKSLASSTQSYRKTTPTVLHNSIDTNTSTLALLCKPVLETTGVNYTRFGNFQLEWLNLFERVMKTVYIPEDNISQSVETLITTAKNKQDQLTAIREKKSQLTGAWYIMRFDV
jgi:hypothetical protein